MHPRTSRILVGITMVGTLLLAVCGGAATTRPFSSAPTAAVADAAPTTAPAAAGEGGEGGVEATLVTYSDTTQKFAIGHPGPWTLDASVTDGVQFNGGDDRMRLELVTPAAAADPMVYAKQDLAGVSSAFPGFKQLDLAPSTEVKGAVVLGFEAQGSSAITGKAYTARGDRYYMPLPDGRLAVLTVVGPSNHYDREGVRDIALTFQLTK
jgi:hypothetical protein